MRRRRRRRWSRRWSKKELGEDQLGRWPCVHGSHDYNMARKRVRKKVRERKRNRERWGREREREQEGGEREIAGQGRERKGERKRGRDGRARASHRLCIHYLGPLRSSSR